LFKSLLFKLIGAFVLVIAISALAISWMTSQATTRAFTLYTTRSGQALAQQLAPTLAEYFKINGSWQGVGLVLQSEKLTGMQGMMSPQLSATGEVTGPGRGQGWRFGQVMGAGMGMLDQHIILADGSGTVISDNTGEWVGQVLSPDQLNNGTPIFSDAIRLGTVLVTPGSFQANTPGGQFLQSVKSSIWVSTGIAALISLLLGSLLFFQITSPIQKLRNATHAVAGGDLNQRVNIQSQDELGELGRSFNDMAEKLSQAETLRRNMVADVAHELRTPLAVMQANLEGIQDGVLPLDQEQVETLHAQTLLLSRLVSDLRLLSLAEAGQLQFDFQDIDAGRVLRQVADQFASQLQQREVSLILNAPEGLPPVHADSDRIRQVLSNLIDNAMRYTPAGGTITLQVSDNGDGIRISVTDTGTGISSEDLPHIFDRFYRADHSRARISGGSGLGLAIVKKIVEAQNGRVGAESPAVIEDGKAYGTQIWLWLPSN
jgi:signal transduction histidine kinase